MAAQIPTLDEIEAALRRIVREELERQGGGSDSLSTSEAARVAGVSVKTVQGWVASEALPSRRRGSRLVIQRADLLRYLSGETPPTDPVVASLRRGA